MGIRGVEAAIRVGGVGIRGGGAGIRGVGGYKAVGVGKREGERV